jgi:hypothetical protein
MLVQMKVTWLQVIAELHVGEKVIWGMHPYKDLAVGKIHVVFTDDGDAKCRDGSRPLH